MRFRLRTLMIILALGPPIVAFGWWYWFLLPLAVFPVVFVWATLARMWAGLAASANGDEAFLAVIYTITIAVTSVIAGLFVAFRVYLAFGTFPGLLGEQLPRAMMDLFIALAAGSVPGALLYWLTWPRKCSSG